MGGACVRPRSTDVAALKPMQQLEAPSPQQIVSEFETTEFAMQPYADTMFRRGREPKSDGEKVYRSKYTAELLINAASAAIRILPAESHFPKAWEDIRPLEETIVFDSAKWKSDVVPKYQAAIDAISGESESPELEQLRGMLFKVKDLFHLEMQNPKQDFYMVILDEMHSKYSGGRTVEKKVSQESLKMMHSIDMPVHQQRSNGRRDVIAACFMRLYGLKFAGLEPWDLEAVVAEHGTREERGALSSQTPLLSFELDEREPSYPGFVLMEGSGRLAALNAALDVVRFRHPEFVAPLIKITVLPFEGPEMVRRNLLFFLQLTWRCTFPALEIPGWQGQVSDSMRTVADVAGGADAVREMPRYFGYSPVTPTCCKAMVSSRDDSVVAVAGG